jgi:hypothetical protein
VVVPLFSFFDIFCLTDCRTDCHNAEDRAEKRITGRVAVDGGGTTPLSSTVDVDASASSATSFSAEETVTEVWFVLDGDAISPVLISSSKGGMISFS